MAAGRLIRTLLALVVLLAVVAGCTTRSRGTTGAYGFWQVDPADTDAAIYPETTGKHRAYEPTTSVGRLAVMFHGTGSNPDAHLEVASTMRTAGLHVINLNYEAATGTLNACPDSQQGPNPDCHRELRSETTFGADVVDPDGQSFNNSVVGINQANSVMNRLLKLVEFLKVLSPSGGWEQFQAGGGGTCTDMNATYGACNLDWSKVVLLGHSQGAGVALYMAKFFPVSNVGLFSGTYDAWNNFDGTYTEAGWTTDAFATPTSKIGYFMHLNDIGAGRIRAVADAVGIQGPEEDLLVDPHTTNRITTSYTSECPFDSVPSHNSTSVDLCTPAYTPPIAWRHLAGI